MEELFVIYLMCVSCWFWLITRSSHRKEEQLKEILAELRKNKKNV